MLSYSRLLQPVTYTKKYTLLWPFSMVKGYKNKNKERERESTSNSYPNVPVAVRSGEERRSERGWQRDAGREMQAERRMQRCRQNQTSPWQELEQRRASGVCSSGRGKAEGEQKHVIRLFLLLSHWSSTSKSLVLAPSRSYSLLLVSDQFQFASLQLSRTHQSRWRSFVFGLFLWLFVYRFYLYFLLFIIIFYQRHRSQTYTHTQAHKLGYRATLRAVWATLRKIRHRFSNSLSRTPSMPNLSRITNNERNKNK